MNRAIQLLIQHRSPILLAAGVAVLVAVGVHGWIKMPAMKIYADDGRNDLVDSEIHVSFSFVSQCGVITAICRTHDQQV